MKILIIGRLRFSGDIPVFLYEALKKIGQDVKLFTLDYDISHLAAFLDDNFRKVGSGDPRRLQKYLVSKQIIRLVKEFCPDLLIIYGSNYYLSPKALIKIKKTGCMISIWEGNLKIFEPAYYECLKHYDIFFSNDAYVIPLLERVIRLKQVHYLKAAAEPDIYKPYKLSAREKELYGTDVAFLGVPKADRIDFFSRLPKAGYTFKIWGRGWDGIPGLLPYVQKKQITTIHKPRVYCAAKINLDFHTGHFQVDSFSSRVFEVLCCGAFLLTEYRKSLEQFFEIGKEIDVFHTPQEAADKIKFYLENPETRKAVAQRGREKVIKNWTITHTAQRIVSIVEKIKANPV